MESKGVHEKSPEPNHRDGPNHGTDLRGTGRGIGDDEGSSKRRTRDGTVTTVPSKPTPTERPSKTREKNNSLKVNVKGETNAILGTVDLSSVENPREGPHHVSDLRTGSHGPRRRPFFLLVHHSWGHTQGKSPGNPSSVGT